MRLYILAIILCFSAFLPVDGQQYNLDSTFTERYDTASHLWSPAGKSYYYWDAQCLHRLIQLNFSWNAAATRWDSAVEYIYNYDSLGNMISESTRNGNGAGVLFPFVNMNYQYNGSTLLTTTSQRWFNYLSAFRNTGRSVYHYNNAALNDTIFTQTWDTATSAWNPYTEAIYNYNAAGLDTSILFCMYNSGTGSYTVFQKEVFSYNTANKVDTEWVSNVGSGTILVNGQRNITVYDPFFNVTSFLMQTRRSDTSSWVNYTNDEYTLKTNGQDSILLYYQWITASSRWDTLDRVTDYYGCAIPTTGISEPASADMPLYPNPAYSELYISLPAKTGNDVALTILDIQGQILSKQTALPGTNTLYVGQLSPGIYLLRYSDDKISSTHRFVKE